MVPGQGATHFLAQPFMAKNVGDLRQDGPVTSPHPPGPAESVLEAVLERVTFANEETGYTIARVAPTRLPIPPSLAGPDLLTVVGPLLGAQVGESLRLTGRWTTHPRYGRQFEVRSYATVLPATIQGIQRYLGSGLIKGIGPVMAERMVAHFGVDVLVPSVPFSICSASTPRP